MAPDTPARRQLAQVAGRSNPNRVSQVEIARRTGIPQQLISAYINRVARPSDRNAELLEIVLGIDRAAWKTKAERAELAALREAFQPSPTLRRASGE